ncbi:MAG: hypothetical protein ACKPCI_15130 [Dolichospermum sp.]
MNITTIARQTQGTTVLTRQEILETRELAYTAANYLSDRQLLTHMGIFNSLVWRAAVDYEAITKDGDKYLIKPEQWENLLLCSVAGNVQITVAIDWTEEYLKKNWPGAFYTNVTLRTYRKQQMSWGLFYFDIENRPKGAFWGSIVNVPKQGVATPPILERLDVARILIFYQTFDQVRRSRINKKLRHSEDITAFSCMPDHGGMLMVELYNALFVCICDFRGNSYGCGDIIIQSSESMPVDKILPWKWRFRETPHNKQHQHLYRAAWQRMVERAGFVVKQATKTVCVLVEPLGTLAEVPF